MYICRKFETGICFNKVSFISIFLHGQIKMSQRDPHIHFLDISQGIVLEGFMLIEMDCVP